MRIGFHSRCTRDPPRFTTTLGGDPDIATVFKGNLLGAQAWLPKQPHALSINR
jgi:hypothetical protein